MKAYSIHQNQEPGLSQFRDERGAITDIFYDLDINHGCVITNEPGAIRGNHYHRHTTQYTWIISGFLTYYSRSTEPGAETQRRECVPGDFIISPPGEIHAMRAGGQGCTFVAFAGGPRGGKDYEQDTYRVDSIIGD